MKWFTRVQGELRSVKGDASNIGRTAESREKEVDRLKQSIKTLEEAKKTLQADKAAVTGEKMNLELQLKSNGARLQVRKKRNYFTLPAALLTSCYRLLRRRTRS
jgi:chromosome segregation ATPase